MSRVRTRRGTRAFTLVELLVSLAAGLIVAMAVVGLSRDATNTFYEEARAQSAETALRLAIDRLRTDIQHAGYMASANVAVDPKVPLDPLLQGTPFAFTAPTVLANLQGIRVWTSASGSGSKVASGLLATLSNANFGRYPDYVEIGGNLTSPDDFPITTSLGAGACAGPRVNLQINSPSVWRVMQLPNPDAALQNLFQPVAGQPFMVRIAGPNGRYGFAMGCSPKTAGVSGGQPYVDLAADPGLTNQFGFITGSVTVNPVEVVRWSVRAYDPTNDTSYSAIAPGGTAVGDDAASKYYLVREWIGSDGNPLPGAELVAEYAADFEVALTADLGNYTSNPGTPAPTSYGYANGGNDTVAGGGGTIHQPQRVRAVRILLSTRTGGPDRAQAISLPNNTYPLRYCLLANGCTNGQRQWGRLRTLTTEIALPNQARLTY